MGALYEVTYFGLFVKFFVLKLSARPRVRPFYSLSMFLSFAIPTTRLFENKLLCHYISVTYTA